MITTVTLNPAIDREYFIDQHQPGKNKYIYDDNNLKVTPGGKGLITAINLKNLGYNDVQNIGFIGGRQGLFFEKMVQDHEITTNYVYTEEEIRNNVKIIADSPVTYTQFNDYTYRVDKKDVEELLKRFKRSIGDSEIILLAGSVPEGVNFDIYEKLINICNEENKEVYLQASGQALTRALSAEPLVVFPYFKHTDKIMEERVQSFEDYIKMGKKLIESGAQHVILPYHCDRLLFDGDKVYSLSTIDFCLRNWLGAGDAYNAGFLDYYFRYGLEFIEANRYGGAAALGIAEANTVFIEDRSFVEESIDRIIIKELEV
ncbi:MAG: 1-phosphofructokinase family hexose kinase [Halanaerobiales bacterium]